MQTRKWVGKQPQGNILGKNVNNKCTNFSQQIILVMIVNSFTLQRKQRPKTTCKKVHHFVEELK